MASNNFNKTLEQVVQSGKKKTFSPEERKSIDSEIASQFGGSIKEIRQSRNISYRDLKNIVVS